MAMRTSLGVGRLSLEGGGGLDRDVVEADALMKATLETRQELESWINEQKSRLLNEKREFEFAEQELARLSTEAQRKRELLQHEHREATTNAHDQQSKVTAQEVEIEVLKSEKAKKEPVLRELFDANQQKDEQLKHLVREAENQRSSWAQQLGELQRGLAMYAQLGLTFEQSDNEKIGIRFTQIDPANPQREFSFSMCIDPESGSIVAGSCDPPVAALSDLLHEVNATADFSTFVRAMRREFKKLV